MTKSTKTGAGRAELTRDALFDGAVRLWQPAQGYRVNVDALLLAAFAASRRRVTLSVDLGAGVGAVSLALAHLGSVKRLELVEKEPRLAELARRNLAAAELGGAVHLSDLERDGLPQVLVGRADLVICNPPYFEPGSGRRRRDLEQHDARSGSLAPFVAAAARALAGPSGRVAFVYPARALANLILAASALSLVPKRLRFVHARADRSARLALIELRRGRAGGLEVEPPLIEWSSAGKRSPELAALVKFRAADRK